MVTHSLACVFYVAQMMEDDLGGVFHDPVDLDAYPSYEEKVDEPMDFGTIKAKLDNWEYRRNDPLGFARDMRLVSLLAPVCVYTR